MITLQRQSFRGGVFVERLKVVCCGGYLSISTFMADNFLLQEDGIFQKADKYKSGEPRGL